jgi:hypothetical protein
MINFGEGMGISLDDLSTTEELQGRLNEIAAAWNELPPGATFSSRLGSMSN